MWRDLFGKKPEPSRELASALADLDRLARDRPELESPAKTPGLVISAAFATPPRSRTPYDFCAESAWYDDVQRAWASGGTAFGEYPPGFDGDDLRDRTAAIINALKADNPSAKSLLRADIDWRDLAVGVVWGDESGIAAVALDCLVPIDLLASVVRLAILPVLAVCSAELAPHRPERASNTSQCPNCGRPPALAESRGLEGLRFLRCGICAADWPALRLSCVACGETSPKSIRSLFVEGEESRHRLVACDSCGCRLKVVSTLGPLSAPGLLVAELATMHLDFV